MPNVNLSVPTHAVAKIKAVYVQIPSSQGSMGILRNHAPLRCTLDPGVVLCKLMDESQVVFAISSGLAMILHDEVTILADTAEPVEQIDVARATAAMERARQRVEAADATIDHARAEAALRRALARLNACRAAGRYQA
jgi:F-type H+-transporting ATPase subunit epsilon